MDAPKPARRSQRGVAAAFILIVAVPPALAGLLGYRLANWQAAQKGSWESPGEVREAIKRMRMQETVAGQFESDGIPLAGIEACYYADPIDFTKVVWVPRDIPTPFLTFAPGPGPIPGGFVNDQQFRYGRNLQRPKPADTCRIFIVGGSVAFGTCARSNETTIAGYLERHLNAESPRWRKRFEVVTAADANWNSSHERIMVENRLLDWEPDVVVALSGYNDAGCGLFGIPVNNYRGGPDLYFVVLANAMLKQESSEGFPLDVPGERQEISPHDTAIRLRRNAELSCAGLQMVGADYCFALQPILSTTRKVLTPREEFMLQRSNRVVESAAFVERFDECRALLAAVKQPHFQLLDLTDVFDAEPQTDIFIDQCHFGDRGNDVIARRLRDRLTPILTARLKP